MKKMYMISTKFNRIKVIVHILAHNTWMCCERRGGKLVITNHGRSKVKSFLQETEDKIVQQAPRNGVRPKQKSTVQDARELLTDLPNFFSLLSFLLLALSLNAELVKADELTKQTPNTETLQILKRGQKNRVFPLEPGRTMMPFQQLPKLNASAEQQERPESERSKQAKKKIRGVAELYEKQFLREMVKQMRATVNFSEISKPSFAEGYFSEQLDQQYVEKWGDRGGVGMGDMIYQQLLSQYGPRMGIQ